MGRGRRPVVVVFELCLLLHTLLSMELFPFSIPDDPWRDAGRRLCCLTRWECRLRNCSSENSSFCTSSSCCWSFCSLLFSRWHANPPGRIFDFLSSYYKLWLSVGLSISLGLLQYDMQQHKTNYSRILLLLLAHEQNHITKWFLFLPADRIEHIV